MATLPSGTLDFWEAFDAVEPIGEEWMQAATVAHQSSLYAYCKAGKKPLDVEEYMPSRYRRTVKAKKVELPTAEESKMQFQALVGFFGFGDVADGNND